METGRPDIAIPDEAAPRSVARLLGVFEAIAGHAGAMSLAELSVALASPKSSLLVMLRQLVAHGYLVHADARYHLGPDIYRLASDVLRHRRFPDVARARMAAVAQESGETVILATLDAAARTVTYVECIESRHAVRYVVPMGSTRPLYCSAAGLCLLAHQDEAWQAAYLGDTPLVALTPLTMTDPATLRVRLAGIRRDGVAESAGEAVADAAGVAAPIVDADGAVRTALLVAAPVQRFGTERTRLVTLVRAAAADISAAMGHAAAPVEAVPAKRRSRPR